MTTIIGIEHKNKCFIVADSQTTDADGKIYSHPEVKKITENGSFLIAGSGETLACDITQHIWEPPVPTKQDKEDLYRFMIVKAMPSLRKCMTENGYNFDEDTKEFTHLPNSVTFFRDVFESEIKKELKNSKQFILKEILKISSTGIIPQTYLNQLVALINSSFRMGFQ